MRPIKKGSTDQSVVIRIVDSTTGVPETAVEHDSVGIDLWYRREGATKTSITEAALAALDSAHADGGIEHIGDGYYRLDLPDAAFATGVNGVMIGGAVTGMVVIGCYVHLVDYDPQDAVRLGLTALPNAAADAAGGLPISDAGGLDMDAMRSNVSDILTDTGTTLQGELDGIQADTEDIQSRLPAALVNSRMDCTIDGTGMESGAVAAVVAGVGLTLASGTIGDTGNSTTALHLTGLTYGDDELNDYLIVIRDVSESEYHARWISDWTATGDLATVSTLPFTPQNSTDTYTILAVRQDVTGGSGPSAADIADAVLDEALSGHTNAGSLGKAIADIEVDTSTTLQGELDGIQADTEDIQSRLPAALTGAGNMKVDVLAVSGDATAADTLELFAEALDQTTGQIDSGSFAAGAIDAAAIAADAGTEIGTAVWASAARTLTALDEDSTTLDLDTTIRSALGLTDNNLDTRLSIIEDASFLIRTTIATLATQTSFTLTDGSTDNDAYNGCVIVVEDASTATQKAVGVVSDYTGSTKTIALLTDPAVFTMAVGDSVTILADRGLKPTVDNRTLDVTATGAAGLDWANVENPTTTVGLSGTTVKTATDVETDTADIQSRLGTPSDLGSGASVAANLVDIESQTDDIGAAGAGLTALATAAELAKVPKSDSNVTWNATALASIQTEAEDALIAHNLDHLVKSAVDTNFATTVHLDSVIGQLADNGTTATFDRTTDSLEAVRDRGDAAWITATGFSTHTAADVWSSGTRTLTALDEDSTTLDLDATIRAAVGMASANLDTQLADLPTVAEFEARTIAAATYATAANLATVAGYLDTEIAAILEDTGTTIPAQISALNNLSAAQVNAEVDTALADIHLDHLLAADYDPANKPGTATALLNELVESDSGVSRFTTNALEQSPTGAGGFTSDDRTTLEAIPTLSEIWTTALTEAYAADGAAFTPAQGLFMIWSALTEFSVSGTSITAKKLDGTTTSMVFTMDSSSSPTSRTRSS